MLSAGIVGLPNVGKSTLFNAVTRTRKAQAANYPFCTIDPNLGVVTVPDPRLETLSKLSHSQKIIPAAIEFVDIAGLVKGASAGEGLGNQFLSHIREVNAIVQVVRCFENARHPSRQRHDRSGARHRGDQHRAGPGRSRFAAETARSPAKGSPRRLENGQGGGRRHRQTSAASRRRQTGHHPRIDATRKKSWRANFSSSRSKPTLFACNVAESDLARDLRSRDSRPNAALRNTCARSQDYARNHFATEAVVISAQIESELVDLSETEAQEYLRDLGVAGSGVGALIRAVYHLLGLRTYLTTGEKETRAWTIRAGDKAPAAAGVIHSDFERGFIAAETVHFDDLVSLGSFAKAREAGKLRIEGKEYVVQGRRRRRIPLQRLTS